MRFGLNGGGWLRRSEKWHLGVHVERLFRHNKGEYGWRTNCQRGKAAGTPPSHLSLLYASRGDVGSHPSRARRGGVGNDDAPPIGQCCPTSCQPPPPSPELPQKFGASRAARPGAWLQFGQPNHSSTNNGVLMIIAGFIRYNGTHQF